MEKPTYKVAGQPCGHHGQYTFYKALRVSGQKDRIIAIGDFFFVRVWQDSELVSIGELQLLWKDRISEQTLVSLRLYFLPENTPDGRNLHGEHEVLAINDKVVLKAEDLLSWMCTGESWTWGVRAVWRGACAPPAPTPETTAPLLHTKLDFGDIDKEKSAIEEEPDECGVVVFSYPRYCRYRAVAARLEGLQADWLRDSLVAALGGYAAPTTNTRILYCKDTFEYPELEGHEFVCNHLAPKLKGRGRGRRRRLPRSRTQSPESRSSDDEPAPEPDLHPGPRRISLRHGPEKTSSGEETERRHYAEEERHFLRRLKHFYKDRNESLSKALTLKHMSLSAVYLGVVSRGGYEAVCRHKLWRVLFTDQPVYIRRHYERYLLAFENHERSNGVKANGYSKPIDTIHVADSPLRDDPQSPKLNVDCETGEIKEETTTSTLASELNKEFLASLPAHPSLPPPPPASLWPHDTGSQEYPREMRSLPPPAAYPPSALNGHAHSASPDTFQKSHRRGTSSLRSVRVKPGRQSAAQPSATSAATAPNTPPTSYPLLCESLSGSSSPPAPPAPPVTNFGIHHPPAPPPPATNSDDEIVEVPYKPKTPEIIDLDEYPESPQSVKKKKLDILKERGLEVTALPAPAWPALPPVTPVLAPTPLLLNPAVQHQIMANAQLLQMYNIIPPNYPNGILPPRVIQATSIFGSTSPEKTVYGNPKDPFMPPPHVLHGVPIKPTRALHAAPATQPQDILDLTCKLTAPPPAVEIVRVPNTPPPSKPHNLAKNYSIVDGKAVVGSNLEITLVNKSQTTPKKDVKPQKRSSNGKFVAKTPTPPKDTKYPKKPSIVVPSYQIRDDPSPTGSVHSTSSRESGKEPSKQAVNPPMSFLDPYMALYNLAGQMDPRQLAAYRDMMANQFRGYSNLLNMGVANPTTKN